MSKINETNYPRRPQSDYEDTDMLIIQEAGGNTYTTRIEDIREDCQETIAPTVEAVNDALAPPENGSTASQSYAIGEHFMRNGDFCTAIAAITSGASFTLNTNYVVGTIAETLESLSSDLTPVAMTFDNYVTFDSSKATKTGTNYIYKEGNNVYAHINFNTKTDTSAQVIVGSTSLKPKGDIYTTAICWSDKAIVPIALQNTGNIKMYNPLANTEYSFYVAYVV